MLLSDHLIHTGSAPTVADVERTASLANPVIRNLQITQCYCELSSAISKRMGSGANWCTFATWASKQAGQTIRSEDLQRTLESLVKKEKSIEEALSLLAILAKHAGAKRSVEQLQQTALGVLLKEAAVKAADAVSRGNKKVFEEIAWQFARFITECFGDETYQPDNIDSFCRQLKAGPPPNGQDYLRKAFTRYYTALFETDPKIIAELQFLANLEIGFHEQTRLQPEIAEALNAGMIDTRLVKEKIFSTLFKDTGLFGKLRLLIQRLLGKTGLLDEAINSLMAEAQKHLRLALTAHLMTLTLPPANRIRLGHDLTLSFPPSLQKLVNTDLLNLLLQVDPTPDSPFKSGATDWADLKERLHFIADLFRCHHEDDTIFSPAFSPEQVMAIKGGQLPSGNL